MMLWLRSLEGREMKGCRERDEHVSCRNRPAEPVCRSTHLRQIMHHHQRQLIKSRSCIRHGC
jgi:hypothetical protein